MFPGEAPGPPVLKCGRGTTMLIGLTGGIACGKSLVAKLFRELGAHVIDADALGHRLLEPGQPGYYAVVEAFGPLLGIPAIPSTDPSHHDHAPHLDRSRLGAVIFANPAQRAQLEAILHPLIFAEASRQRRAIETSHAGALILFEAPLLYETGADSWVQRTIVVSADEATQLSRLMARDGLTREEAQQRIASQLPVAVKRQRADYCIDGGAPPDEVRHQVTTLYATLTGS
jgi:dephospho-CoA kinase